MRFQLLGPLSITDGHDVAVLPPAKPTSLLAALLVRPGEVVPADRLRRAVWGEAQPAAAKAALQSCVLRLRRLFSKYGVEERSVLAVAGGYRLSADGDTLDLLHFRRLVSEAAGAGDSELPLLRTALGLWRGPLLANVPSELLHRDEVPRLVEERLRVLERVCEIQLARGRCREVLVDLWEATRTHPQHEGFAAQLMRALYRAGRQREALAEYGRIRSHLRDELGVDPGAELRGLELAILRGEEPHRPAEGPASLTRPRTPDDTPAVGPAETTATPHAHDHRHAHHHATPLDLPPPPDTAPAPAPAPTPAVGPEPAHPPRPPLPRVPGFTGRARESADLVAHLDGGPADGQRDAAPVLAVISGGPGMGKTALALHAARLAADRYPAGGVLLPLTGPDGRPRRADEASAALRATLPGTDRGPCLVILDDVVHPDQVRGLLDLTGRGAVLVTSRLGLAALVATHGPAVLRLGALPSRDSHALLTAVLGAERVAAEAAAARALTDTCGHVPLALRIAAARLLTRPKLRLADYTAWLRRDLPGRLALPDDPRMSVPLALDGALDRLPGPLAEAHLRLARLGGRITPAGAAGALHVPETRAEEVLERLLDAGLLDEEQPGALHMNPLFRAHALHRAARTGGLPPAVPVPQRRALPSGAT
ncbi:AfsR/SARP family transcriptional regulator [Streptomyces tagetis]|uniref:AfsR/SARP family transcriptional regulator n=1 Tax=Streptomyces tagetis TaxID=2820809 RepID=A0A941AZB9_9ACTN|nr:AfsR/SARP family transcriptional regulator [Streptomyces sp. RG38]MBQ0825191.1 AfsR/SARP family transcriptional regulator [Streptomyces sp. RG38]